jgi:hypothetical protein
MAQAPHVSARCQVRPWSARMSSGRSGPAHGPTRRHSFPRPLHQAAHQHESVNDQLQLPGLTRGRLRHIADGAAKAMRTAPKAEAQPIVPMLITQAAISRVRLNSDASVTESFGKVALREVGRPCSTSFPRSTRAAP